MNLTHKKINDYLYTITIILLLISSIQVMYYRFIESKIIDNYYLCEAPDLLNINKSDYEDYVKKRSGELWTGN